MRLLSLSDMHSRFLDVFSWCDGSFFFFFPNCWITSIVWRHHCFLRHSPAEQRFCCFSILAFVSEAPINICVLVFMWTCLQLCVCLVASNSLWPHALKPAGFLCPWNFPGKNTGVGCHFLLQGDLSDPGIEPTSLASPALAGRFFTSSTTWEARFPTSLGKNQGAKFPQNFTMLFCQIAFFLLTI